MATTNNHTRISGPYACVDVSPDRSNYRRVWGVYPTYLDASRANAYATQARGGVNGCLIVRCNFNPSLKWIPGNLKLAVCGRNGKVRVTK